MPGFKNIAVASTFSPRFLPLLAEARQFSQRFGTTLSVIHAGARDEKSEQVFGKAFADFGFEPVPEVHWAEGETPDRALIDTIATADIDLLILGALEKETPGRQFLGNVARSLMRSASCSLLYLTKPRLEGTRLRTLVLAADHSATAQRGLEIGAFLAKQDSADKLHIVSVLTVFAQARATQEGSAAPKEGEERWLAEFAKSGEGFGVPLDTRCIQSTTGFAASEFVQTIGADLLIVPSAEPDAPVLFPDGMDWIRDTIPTNLLVLRGAAPAV